MNEQKRFYALPYYRRQYLIVRELLTGQPGSMCGRNGGRSTARTKKITAAPFAASRTVLGCASLSPVVPVIEQLSMNYWRFRRLLSRGQWCSGLLLA